MSSLKELFDRAGDGVAVIDASYRIIYWNQSAQEILGYSPAQAVGRSCFEIFKGMGERGTVVCGPECSLSECAFRGERMHSFNLLTPHKDGRTVWLNVSTLYVREFDGHRNAIAHLFRDIDQLQRARELMGEFLLRAWEVATAVPPPQKVSQQSQESLTKREQEVLVLLGEGLTTKEIAGKLSISEATTRNHIQSILNKLGVHSQLEAVLYAQQHELI